MTTEALSVRGSAVAVSTIVIYFIPLSDYLTQNDAVSGSTSFPGSLSPRPQERERDPANEVVSGRVGSGLK